MNQLDVTEKRDIQKAIMRGDYKEADVLLQNYKDNGYPYDDIIAVLDAAIGEHYQDRVRVWEAIQNGLMYNGKNYELYVMLGNYYLAENIHKSWLCYENAWFYCDVPEDRKDIEQLLCQTGQPYGGGAKKAGVVIVCHDHLEYIKLCVQSIRGTTPVSAREIVVVDLGSRDGTIEWLKGQEDISFIEGTEEMGYIAGYNQGIRACSRDSDILLLADNTILTVNALFWLRMGLYDNEKNGTAGSVTNLAQNKHRNQMFENKFENTSDIFALGEKINVPMKYAFEYKIFLMNFALLIRRSVLDQIGLLDEEFSSGRQEDEDYGLRVLMAGYRNVLCKNSFILQIEQERIQNKAEQIAALEKSYQRIENYK